MKTFTFLIIGFWMIVGGGLAISESAYAGPLGDSTQSQGSRLGGGLSKPTYNKSSSSQSSSSQSSYNKSRIRLEEKIKKQYNQPPTGELPAFDIDSYTSSYKEDSFQSQKPTNPVNSQQLKGLEASNLSKLDWLKKMNVPEDDDFIPEEPRIIYRKLEESVPEEDSVHIGDTGAYEASPDDSEEYKGFDYIFD
ncbi:MAG: hypothetical protein JSW40_03075 [Candidatus Omnitrophota bacterium]|nr:MAG: hypothetical protein JSW40_03075 [Candidatus Omnitrophota bacterium]